MCQLCDYDAAYYGDVVRPFECLNICFRCYALDMCGFYPEHLDMPAIHDVLRTGFLALSDDIAA